MKTDTPQTDAAWASWTYAGPGVHANFARKLERERDEARKQHAADVDELNARLTKQQSDMLDTIVELRRENVRMQYTMQIIYDATEGCADGAPDASAHDKLCNEIADTLKPFIK
jgi:Mg2+ and Co2+ transporter CorA